LEHDNYRVAVRLILQASQNGTPHHEHVIVLGQTPKILVDIGFAPLLLAIKAKTIDKAHFDHGMTAGMLERLYELIDKPKAIYRSATLGDGHVVVTFQTKGVDLLPVVVAIHSNKAIGRAPVVNEVASLYAKNNPNIEALWSSQGLRVW
jgi:hypothetical protein